MISPITRLLNYLEQAKGITITHTETAYILDKVYTVVKGSIREKPDYDDAWLLALAKDAHKVFDIGCNLGQSALLILHSGQVNEILLVDPDPDALSKAAQNLIYNNWSQQARFKCAFVSNKQDEQIYFYSTPRGAASSMYASHATTATNLEMKKLVSTTTIDYLVDAFNTVPDLIKIDTEGAERLVLQGAVKLAKRQSTRFFVEMHSNVELSMHDNAQAILAWCGQVNYRAWYLKEKIELISPETISHRGRCHLLLLPIQEEFPDYLTYINQGSSLKHVPHNHLHSIET